MSKLLAALIAAMFAIVTTGSFAAAHAGAQPMKDGMKKEEMKKDGMAKADKPAKKAKKSKKAKKAEDKK